MGVGNWPDGHSWDGDTLKTGRIKLSECLEMVSKETGKVERPQREEGEYALHLHWARMERPSIPGALSVRPSISQRTEGTSRNATPQPLSLIADRRHYQTAGALAISQIRQQQEHVGNELQPTTNVNILLVREPKFPASPALLSDIFLAAGGLQGVHSCTEFIATPRVRGLQAIERSVDEPLSGAAGPQRHQAASNSNSSDEANGITARRAAVVCYIPTYLGTCPSSICQGRGASFIDVLSSSSSSSSGFYEWCCSCCDRLA
ncbi:hypothetical protein B0T20DRAFT_392299 [Sordaria brevicollis]|uniref:Uncharacterized protein n=1 Tax=Sordaria brevicollis TaxID=83679 RepID=A0AAE0PG44_SORBR|nr:hypothetical protein B0T20DRAFT_392299 [Sordaria brevicollis]